VIVCTHNPRMDFLTRVLAGLRAQTLDPAAFEIVVVDNNSDTQLADALDITWHPNARVVREDKPGLTAARLRGLKETRGAVIVFVDDDNILAPDYLEQALRIAEEWPQLGAWGGSTLGDFEVPPPPWAKRLLFGQIGVRTIESPQWSNKLMDSCPIGAGMVLRRTVAEAYASSDGSVRDQLGRSAGNLMGGEDIDLANTACRIGLGTGLFPQLSLTHIMPKERLTLEYAERITRDITLSLIRMKQGYGIPLAPYERLSRQNRYKAMRRRLQLLVKPHDPELRVAQARWQGVLLANRS